MLDAISASQFAMQVDQIKLQNLNQNVANMKTPAFKKQFLDYQKIDDSQQPQFISVLNQMTQDQLPTQGSLTQTQKEFDLALAGAGYFQVQGDEGIYYTRRGDFHLNEQGELTTATGETVLGRSGAIRLDEGHLKIDAEGAIYVDNKKIDQLRVVTFDQEHHLIYAGNGLYHSEESPAPVTASTRVLHGFIEQSNVKAMDEMMEMIKTSRHFEASQRVMRTANNLLGTAINQLGEGNV